MPTLLVDESRCIRDGVCLSECPLHMIELRDDSPVPSWVASMDGRCVECGHCVAICPEGALSLSTMPVELCPPINRDLFFTPSQVEHHMRARRSFRRYQDRPVPREVLERLIAAASYAPTGANSQPVHWLVAYDGDLVRRLAQHTLDWIRTFLDQPEPWWGYRRVVECWERGEDIAIRGTAPHLIFAHAGKDAPYGPRTSCTIALTYLEIAAPAYGLGTCWAGFLNGAANDWPPMREALGLPEDHQCFGAMMIGYPSHEFARVPTRKAGRVIWR